MALLVDEHEDRDCWRLRVCRRVILGTDGGSLWPELDRYDDWEDEDGDS